MPVDHLWKWKHLLRYKSSMCYITLRNKELYQRNIETCSQMAGSLNTSAEYNYQNAIGRILFVMLIGAIVFLLTLGIQCLGENENTAKVRVVKSITGRQFK